jgi:hypothetical protein
MLSLKTYFEKHFENVRLVRMSDGSYRLIRDLGLVKGGKGLRSHEPLLTFKLHFKPVKAHVPLSALISEFWTQMKSQPAVAR